MKERPILFSTPMVQAILQARKTKTRRIVGNGIGFAYSYKQNKRRGAVAIKDLALLSQTDINELIPHCQKGQVGDILWVRETFRPDGLIFTADSRAQFSYKADFLGC